MFCNFLDTTKNRIFIIVFSNFEFSKLRELFPNPNIFHIDYLVEVYNNSSLIKELKEEAPAINFYKNSNNFWIEIPQINTNHMSFLNNQIPEEDKNKTDFNESIKKARTRDRL